jgi:hypothetical protein
MNLPDLSHVFPIHRRLFTTPGFFVHEDRVLPRRLPHRRDHLRLLTATTQPLRNYRRLPTEAAPGFGAVVHIVHRAYYVHYSFLKENKIVIARHDHTQVKIDEECR